jgi:hypothetical protein
VRSLAETPQTDLEDEIEDPGYDKKADEEDYSYDPCNRSQHVKIL